MSQTPDAESSDDRNAFTCGTLLACLCIPGLSKKKPEEVSGKSGQPTAPEQDQHQPTEQEHPQVPSRAASLEKLECSSLYSGSNIVFDFLAVEGDDRGVGGIHGYCPSPCFDLPAELIRTGGERCGVDDAPVTSDFVFDGYRDGPAMKKMASCLASGVPDGTAARPTHLVRFLSASDSGVPVRPPVTSFGPANGG